MKVNLVRIRLDLRALRVRIYVEKSSDTVSVCRRQKFYKTMSEIKSEVEYVIKTGRQVVEKKQVDSPDVLNTQIDAIKQLYNELGAQVNYPFVTSW